MDGKKAVKTKAAQAEQPAFEEAMTRLEAVTKRLESGEGTLEEMIDLYEQGMGLVTVCNDRLAAYEARITKLSGGDGEEEQP